jgi:hypothetical protein
VNALSYLAVIAALLLIRPLSAVKRHAASGGVREGLRYAAGREQLWLPLVMMALVGLLSTMLSIGSVAGSLGVGPDPSPQAEVPDGGGNRVRRALGSGGRVA